MCALISIWNYSLNWAAYEGTDSKMKQEITIIMKQIVIFSHFKIIFIHSTSCFHSLMIFDRDLLLRII